MAWDPKSLSERFLHIAENAEKYARETREKAKRNRSYEGIHDQTLAEFYVYNYLQGRQFLDSRENFLRVLRSLAINAVPNSGDAFDQGQFALFYSNIIQGLIQQYTLDNP